MLVAACLMLLGRSASAGVFSADVISTFRVGSFTYEIRATEIRRTGPDGALTTVKLPDATKAMIRYFRPTMDQIDHIGSGIGPVFREGDRVWFGLDFYSGEGSAGIGGVGFVDTKTMRAGLLRHPALVDCAASNLSVNAQEIVVDTYYFGEGGTGPCQGRIAIDRGSLRAWACSEKPGAKNPDGTLPCHPPGRSAIKEKGPSPLRRLAPVELDRTMLAETEFERGWFADAVKNGQVTLDQHCIIAPTDAHQDGVKIHNAAVCTVPSIDGYGINMPSLRGVSNYLCEPDGFFALSVQTGAGLDVTAYPNGPRRGFRNDKATQRIPIASAGMTWSQYVESYPADIFVTLVLEDVEPITVHCRDPYQWASGPAIRSAKWWLRVVKVNQDYRPRVANAASLFSENAYAGVRRFVIGTAVNLRAEPDAGGAVLDKPPIATQVENLKTSNEWVLVTLFKAGQHVCADPQPLPCPMQ